MDKEAVVHIYNGILSHNTILLKETLESVLMMWMNLDSVTQLSKSEEKYHILTHIYGI